MKFTLVALLAVFCVLSVNAGTWQPLFGAPETDPEFVPSDFADIDGDFVDPEVFGIFSAVWWACKAALRSLKGFNCLIKWVCGIQDSALQYSADILACGVNANQDVTNLINANLKILNTTHTILNLETTVCASTQDEIAPSITKSCSVKALYQIFSLVKQVKTAVRLAKKIPQTGQNACTCVSDATNTLITYYTAFPSNLKTCSKLTSS